MVGNCHFIAAYSDADYPTHWRLVKPLFAKGLPKDERLSAVPSERGIWHRRYWEYTIAMSGTIVLMSTMCTSTRLSRGGYQGLRIGRFLTFTGLCGMESCRQTGPVVKNPRDMTNACA